MSCCGQFSPVFDDAEVKTREVSGDERLEDTDDPASVKLTVGVCNLHTHTHAHTRTHTHTHTHAHTRTHTHTHVTVSHWVRLSNCGHIIKCFYSHLHAEFSEQVQHVLVDEVHLFGVHSLRQRVEVVQVPKQELQSVS